MASITRFKGEKREDLDAAYPNSESVSDAPRFSRIPRHVGVIPDGNRRWAVGKGMEKQQGYAYGLKPGFELCDLCLKFGIEEITFYGFTQDNTKRPEVQRKEFQRVAVSAADYLDDKDYALLIVGNTDSPMFPSELLPFTKRTVFGSGRLKVNILINYSWQWDLRQMAKNNGKGVNLEEKLGSSEISRIDLILRWGGRRRLSGFPPVQSVYSDIFVIDEFWPDFKPEHLLRALEWYQNQDITLGG